MLNEIWLLGFFLGDLKFVLNAVKIRFLMNLDAEVTQNTNIKD